MFLPVPGGLGVRGSGGANHFTAEVSLDGADIVLGRMSSAALPRSGADYERRYRELLGASDGLLQVRTDLFLYEGSRPSGTGSTTDPIS